MNKTKQTIYEMMVENTGRHMLDSGGAYGRHWERNEHKKLKDFDNEPEVFTDINEYKNEYSYEYSINIFHWLSNQLSLDTICEGFNKLNVDCDNYESEGFEGYGVSKEAWEYLKSHYDINVKNTFNSYNGESNLSQVIQGSVIEIEGSEYLILQIHGGCDVRGGYTDARLFKIDCEYFGCEDVHGVIDDILVDNRYDGYSLKDENENDVQVNKDSKIELELAQW